MINFPSNPNSGDEHTDGGTTWVWNSTITAWQLKMVYIDKEALGLEDVAYKPENIYPTPGGTHGVDPTHVGNIVYLTNDDASSITYTVNPGDLKVGESIELVRADSGILFLAVSAGIVWYPAPKIPAVSHTLTKPYKSVVITRRADAGGVEELFIRGALN